MTTSVSRRLNIHILCIEFKTIAFLTIMLFAWLYVMISILFTRGKHLYDCIISQRGQLLTYITSLAPPLFTEVPILSLFLRFSVGFWKCSDSAVFFVFKVSYPICIFIN